MNNNDAESIGGLWPLANTTTTTTPTTVLGTVSSTVLLHCFAAQKHNHYLSVDETVGKHRSCKCFVQACAIIDGDMDRNDLQTSV